MAAALSGSWSEATHSVSGSISGRANSSDIQAYVSGAGFAASIGIRTHGGGQSVTIRPQGWNRCESDVGQPAQRMRPSEAHIYREALSLLAGEATRRPAQEYRHRP